MLRLWLDVQVAHGMDATWLFTKNAVLRILGPCRRLSQTARGRRPVWPLLVAESLIRHPACIPFCARDSLRPA